MPPKKRGPKKGTKSALSRGRTAKQPKDDGTGTATSSVNGDTTDDNVSEAPTSPGAESTRSGAGGEGSVKGDVVASTAKPIGSAEDSDEDNGWQDIPDLVSEFNKGDGKITYVTSTTRFREYELEERRKLRDDYFDLETLKTTLDSSLRVMRNLYPDVMKGKTCDVIKELGCPTTFEDLVGKLISLPTPAVSSLSLNEPIFEESEGEQEMEAKYGVPFSASTVPPTRSFPSPSKMAKYQTPKNQGPSSVFKFGTHTKGLSTNKAPRLPKPGEVFYSESGSPILQRRVMADSTQPAERVEVLQPDGTKLELDLVYRGAPDGKKLRGFKEFAKDIRGIAASRATSVRQNRVQPPKIGKPAGTQSAVSKSKKPEWR